MKLKNNQSGIAHLGLVLAVLVVVTVGVVGWRVWDNKSTKTVDSQQPTIDMAGKTEPQNPITYKKTTTVPDSWIKYTSTDYPLSFSTPKGWTVNATSTTSGAKFGEGNKGMQFCIKSPETQQWCPQVIYVFKVSLNQAVENLVKGVGDNYSAIDYTFDGHQAGKVALTNSDEGSFLVHSNGNTYLLPSESDDMGGLSTKNHQILFDSVEIK